MKLKTWNEYASERDASDELYQLKQPPKETNEKVVGEPLDGTYRDEAEYKKLLEFLRGKKNVPEPVKPPESAPKGWFIADEASRGFWYDNNWTTDTHLIHEAVIHDEKAAKALAQVVGGIVIPAEEVLD